MSTPPAQQQEGIPERIRAEVQEIEPSAELVLFGSRARGDAVPESDWDVLVLVDGVVNAARRDAIVHRLYDLSLALDTVISPVIHSRDEWNTPLYRAMPFRQQVAREGVRL